MKRVIAVLAAAALVVPSLAAVVLTKGTTVDLAFDQALSSKKAKVGDTVRLHVKNDVRAGGKVVVPAGTKVTGVLSKVEGRKRFGVNATMQITLNPIMVSGQKVTLAPRNKGAQIGGTRGNMAAGAAAGGAAVLGPIGLVGGYFVVGKNVNIKVGDKLETEVTKDVRFR